MDPIRSGTPLSLPPPPHSTDQSQLFVHCDAPAMLELALSSATAPEFAQEVALEVEHLDPEPEHLNLRPPLLRYLWLYRSATSSSPRALFTQIAQQPDQKGDEGRTDQI